MSSGTVGGLNVDRADDGSRDIIVRFAPSAWVLATITFSLGVLVGLLID